MPKHSPPCRPSGEARLVDAFRRAEQIPAVHPRGRHRQRGEPEGHRAAGDDEIVGRSRLHLARGQPAERQEDGVHDADSGQGHRASAYPHRLTIRTPWATILGTGGLLHGRPRPPPGHPHHRHSRRASRPTRRRGRWCRRCTWPRRITWARRRTARRSSPARSRRTSTRAGATRPSRPSSARPRPSSTPRPPWPRRAAWRPSRPRILTIVKAGDHIVSASAIYPSTYHLMVTQLASLGHRDDVRRRHRPGERRAGDQAGDEAGLPGNARQPPADAVRPRGHRRDRAARRRRHDLRQHVRVAGEPAAARPGHRHRRAQRHQVLLRPRRRGGRPGRRGARRSSSAASPSRCGTTAASWRRSRRTSCCAARSRCRCASSGTTPTPCAWPGGSSSIPPSPA